MNIIDLLTKQKVNESDGKRLLVPGGTNLFFKREIET